MWNAKSCQTGCAAYLGAVFIGCLIGYTLINRGTEFWTVVQIFIATIVVAWVALMIIIRVLLGRESTGL